MMRSIGIHSFSVATALWAAALCTLAPGAPAVAEELYTVQVVARAGKFYPDTIEVPAGRRFKLIIRNEGPGAEEFESRELNMEKVLSPGASSFLVFPPLKPGTYGFFGEFHPDTAQGRIIAR